MPWVDGNLSRCRCPAIRTRCSSLRCRRQRLPGNPPRGGPSRAGGRVAGPPATSSSEVIIDELVDLAVLEGEDPDIAAGTIGTALKTHHVDALVHHDRTLGERFD